MQKSTFANGGFVMHKIPTVMGTTVMSVWCDKDGNVLDIERRDGRKPSKSDRLSAASHGRIYK